MKYRFLKENYDTLKTGLIKMRNANVTEAKDFISMLIDFCIDFDIPTKEPLWMHTEDVGRYVYGCLMHKKCAVCGQKADLHHVDRVGMGNDRTQINHIGLRCLPLCRKHHQEAHQFGDSALMEQYHLELVQINEEIARVYKLKGEKKNA